MTHNNNKKLQLSFLLKIKNKNVVSFLLVLQILFFFFLEYFWKRNMMSQKFEESTHDTLFDGQKLNC